MVSETYMEGNMDREMLKKMINWAMDKVSEEALLRAYKMLCRDIDFSLIGGGKKDETGAAVGYSRTAGTDDGEKAAEGAGVCENGTV